MYRSCWVDDHVVVLVCNPTTSSVLSVVLVRLDIVVSVQTYKDNWSRIKFLYETLPTTIHCCCAHQVHYALSLPRALWGGFRWNVSAGTCPLERVRWDRVRWNVSAGFPLERGGFRWNVSAGTEKTVKSSGLTTGQRALAGLVVRH